MTNFNLLVFKPNQDYQSLHKKIQIVFVKKFIKALKCISLLTSRQIYQKKNLTLLQTNLKSFYVNFIFSTEKNITNVSALKFAINHKRLLLSFQSSF